MIKNKKPAQAKRILKHLEKYGSIDPLQALNLFGCFRLAARIAELKKAGYKIESETFITPGGARVSRYFIPAES